MLILSKAVTELLFILTNHIVCLLSHLQVACLKTSCARRMSSALMVSRTQRITAARHSSLLWLTMISDLTYGTEAVMVILNHSGFYRQPKHVSKQCVPIKCLLWTSTGHDLTHKPSSLSKVDACASLVTMITCHLMNGGDMSELFSAWHSAESHSGLLILNGVDSMLIWRIIFTTVVAKG